MTSPTTAQVAAPTERLRSELTTAISETVHARGWTQSTAARMLGRTQPDISDLHRGITSRLALDALVDMALSLSVPIQISGPSGQAPLSLTSHGGSGGLRRALMARMASEMRLRGLSLQDAAMKMGVNNQRVSDIRSGRISRVSLGSTLAMAEEHFDNRVSVGATEA